MSKRKFSILIPSFNRPEFLEKAVDAIKEQDYDNWEIIIQDGGTEHAVLKEDPRIRHIIEPDAGITDAMNRAMNKATGDIFCWANDDDRLSEGTLSFVNENLTSKWGYGYILMMDEPPRQYGETWDFSKLLQSNIVPQPAAFWTREAYEEVGPMDMENDLVSDYEYWLRLGSHFEPQFFDRVMAYYTIHKGQITQTNPRGQLDQAEKVRAKYHANFNNRT